jgi:FkbM family methyltransferase
MIRNATLRALRDRFKKSRVTDAVYQRVRTSWIYDVYWNVADKRLIDDRQRETDFYKNLLEGFREGDLIFDVGANCGYKTDIFLRLGAKVVALEPDETSRQVLKQRFLKYRLRRKPVVIVPQAVSDRHSVEAMWIDAPGSGKNTLSQKWADALRGDGGRFGHKLSFANRKEVETTTLDQLISAHGSPFFVKIDVEGHELSVLRGMQRAVPYLSFEVNLPEFRLEGLECVELLGRLARSGKFNYTADCRRGLAREEWLEAREFSAVLNSCNEKSIEVFWRTSLSI